MSLRSPLGHVLGLGAAGRLKTVEQLEQAVAAVLRSWEGRVEACLAEAIRRRHLPPGSDARGLSKFFWIGWEGAILRSKLTRSVEPLEQFTRFYFEKVAARTRRSRR